MNLAQKQILCTLYKKCALNNHWNKLNENFIEPIFPQTITLSMLQNKPMNNIQIDSIQKSVICGTCLGDTSFTINKNYRNARLQCRHSIVQSAWFFWKWVICLKAYTNGLNSIVLQPCDGYQNKNKHDYPYGYGKLKIASKATADLTKLYFLLYPKNKFLVKRKWLNHMNNYFLMTLWLDDGSLYHGYQGVFCLDSIPKNQLKLLADYFQKVWFIECEIYSTSNAKVTEQKGFRIHLKDQQNVLKLFRLIAPIIPVKEMLYKIKFIPKNNVDLLQNWASEIKQLVQPQFQNYIQSEYEYVLKHYDKTSNM